MFENIEPRHGQDLEVLVIGTWNKKEQYMYVYIVIHGLLFVWNTIDIEVYDRDDNFDSDSRQQWRVKTAHRGKR